MTTSSTTPILLQAFVDATISLLSFILCHRLAHFFYTTILSPETTPRHTSVRRLFTITFTLSLSLILIIIFEALNLMRPTTRRRHWYFTIYALLILLIFVLPTAQVYHILREKRFPKQTSLKFSILAEFLFLYVFYKIGYVFKGTTLAEGWKGTMWVDQAMGRIMIVGTTMLAVLSGFTAVWLPYSYLGLVFRKVGQKEVTGLERRVVTALDDLRREKEVEMENLGNNKKQFIMSTSLQLTKPAEEYKNKVFLQYNQTLSTYNSYIYSKTKTGKCFSFLGAAMLLLCLARVIFAIYNISLHFFFTPSHHHHHHNSNSLNEPPGAEIILQKLLQHLGLNLPLETLYQYATLLFTTILISLNLRSALTRMISLFSLVSTTNNILSTTAAIFISQLLGTYVISSTVLGRRFLPYHTRKLIRGVMGTLEMRFFYRFFDVWFLGSVGVSIVMLGVVDSKGGGWREEGKGWRWVLGKWRLGRGGRRRKSLEGGFGLGLPFREERKVS